MALRDDLTKEIELRLGGQMVDVELDLNITNYPRTKVLKNIDNEVKMQLKKHL